MAGKKMDILNSVSNLEADIMQIVWDEAAISVRDVHEILLKREVEKKEHGFIPYTTVMSIMNSLSEKGLLKQDKKTKTYLYKANIDRQELSKNIIRSISQKLLNNSANSLISNFLSVTSNLSKEEVINLLKKIN
jgi:BlaI family transcriptional regulator, penicillinase repressor